jgi:TonB family protein
LEKKLMERTFSGSEVEFFSLLPDVPTPLRRWFCSGCVHIALIAALTLMSSALHETSATPPRVSRVTLYSPAFVKPFHAVHLNVPQPLLKRAVPAPARIQEALREPAIAAERKQVAAPVVERKRVEIATLEPPRLELPAAGPSASLPATRIAPLPAVKVGGFGDPNGAALNNLPQTQAVIVAKVGAFDRPAGPGNLNATAAGMNLKAVGGFDRPAGPGNGSGLGSGKGVAMAGFGSGYESTNGKGAGGRGSVVRSAGFEGTEGGSQVSKVAVPKAPAETPVDVIWKPKPAYTEEARAKKIEGDVQLEVVFGANGQISILRLLRGLGFGLDENARTAASQIRFRPCTRGGTPIDTKATIHILFALS